MKKTVILLLVCLLAVLPAGCAGEKQQTDDGPKPWAAPSDVQIVAETTEAWTKQEIKVPEEARQAGVEFGFQATDGYGYYVGLDDVQVRLYGNPVYKVTVGATEHGTVNVDAVCLGYALAHSARTEILTELCIHDPLYEYCQHSDY